VRSVFIHELLCSLIARATYIAISEQLSNFERVGERILNIVVL